MPYGPALALGAMADAVSGPFKAMRETAQQAPAYTNQLLQNEKLMGMLPGEMEMAKLQRQQAQEHLNDLPQQRQLRGIQIQQGQQGLETGGMGIEAAKINAQRTAAFRQAMIDAGGDPVKLNAAMMQYGDLMKDHPFFEMEKAKLMHPGRTDSQIEADRARAGLYKSQAEYFSRRPAPGQSAVDNQKQRSLDQFYRTANDMVKKQISGPMGMVDMTRLGSNPIEQSQNYQYLMHLYAYQQAEARGMKGAIQHPGPTPKALTPLLEGQGGPGPISQGFDWLRSWTPWAKPTAPVPGNPPEVVAPPQPTPNRFEGWQMQEAPPSED